MNEHSFSLLEHTIDAIAYLYLEHDVIQMASVASLGGLYVEAHFLLWTINRAVFG